MKNHIYSNKLSLELKVRFYTWTLPSEISYPNKMKEQRQYWGNLVEVTDRHFEEEQGKFRE